jgi:ribokinase
MQILNFGSLNIDYVYRVPRFVRPGETISSTSFKTFAGGKGANQSAALAKAGADVYHAGKVGKDGIWLIDMLINLGVKTEHIRVCDNPTGHAIIQVSEQGENGIFLFPGCNKQITEAEINETLSSFQEDTLLLLQNEINHTDRIMEKARDRNIRICLNPAPFGKEVLDYPLDAVDILIVNETEGCGLSGKTAPEAILNTLMKMWPKTEILLTLGERGVKYAFKDQVIEVQAVKTKVIDTTAAGDTFIGYYLAGLAQGLDIRQCLETAAKAAALSVSRPGAMDSIPDKAELNSMNNHKGQ